MRSALFVDFENTYICLCDIDTELATAFSIEPELWLTRLLENLPPPPDLDPQVDPRRRILMRRSYLAPTRNRAREAFVDAGFEVIDCPRLTGAGKNSADIHMVIDILDALNSETHYDEFILLSADADFTPVLRRLRREDRRTSVLVAGQVSRAFTGASDQLLGLREFLRGALPLPAMSVAGANQQRSGRNAVTQAQLPANGASVPAEPDLAGKLTDLQSIRACLYEIAAAALKPVPLGAVGTALIQRFPDIKNRDWYGHGSCSKLLGACELEPLRLSNKGTGYLVDPRRHSEEDVPYPAPRDQAKEAQGFAITAPAALDGAQDPVEDIDSSAQHLIECAELPRLDRATYRIFISGLIDSLRRGTFGVEAIASDVCKTCAERDLVLNQDDARLLVSTMADNGVDMRNRILRPVDLIIGLSDIAAVRCRQTGRPILEADRLALQAWLSDGVARHRGV